MTPNPKVQWTEPSFPADAGSELSRLRSVAAGLQADVVALQRQIAQEQASAKVMRNALRELVAVKDLKDRDGKTEEYERRQPLAWASARQAMEGSV